MSKAPYTILGISYGHGDSSAALIVGDQLVAAAEEERFTRVKHYANFPQHAIAYCLKHAGVHPADVRVVAIAKRPKNAFFRKLNLVLRHPYLANAHRSEKEKSSPSLAKLLKEAGLKRADIFRVEHHYAHQMSTRFLAEEPDAAFFSFDGLGDFVSAAFGCLNRSKLEIFHRTYYPHSLGFFYTAMTQYLGFPYFGDEFKVMGLSAYGQPTYMKEMRELVRLHEPYGFHLNLEAFPIAKTMNSYSVKTAQPYVAPIFNSSFLTQLLGIPARKLTEPLGRQHWDLAKSVQQHFEDIASSCLKQLHNKTQSHTLCLSGGCAHNSVWVGKIARQTPFKKILVAPASHDAGIAVGAAIAAADREINAEGRHWALLGPDLTEVEENAKRDFDFEIQERSFAEEDKLCEWMVKELCEGKIIGLVHGRMEFGPRALGNRSILADPRIKEMKERLNERVKHREPFRPFAASVLWEYQKKWFKDSFFSPAMDAVFQVEDSARNKIPAVVHNDNSCRIQSVRKETQPFYWRLIDTFREKTGVPMLLNTSFNDCEPMVCSAKDALNCFANTDLDHLVLGKRVLSRTGAKIALTA
ncbi:MAG: hypothetical protein KDD51_14650 [Bdellovibrionales bacterium]|nr:hypothetical protein [Bdellovibrionales bacterium]